MQTLFRIDDFVLPNDKMMNLLRASGALGDFVRIILREWVIEQGLQKMPPFSITEEEVTEAVIEFRLRNNLDDPVRFGEWLRIRGFDAETFRDQAVRDLRVDLLRKALAEQGLAEWWAQQGQRLDRVNLSRIVLNRHAAADEAMLQLKSGTNFEALARAISLSDDKDAGGALGTVSLESLPFEIRDALRDVPNHSLVGPIKLNNVFFIFLLHERRPANLDDPATREMAVDRLFQDWLDDRIALLNVELMPKD